MYHHLGNKSIYNQDFWLDGPVDQDELRATAQMTDDEYKDYLSKSYDPEYIVNGKDDTWGSVPFGDYTGYKPMKSNLEYLSESKMNKIIKESINRVLKKYTR